MIGITLTYFFLTGSILLAMLWTQSLYVFVGAVTIVLTLSIAYILSLIFIKKLEIESFKNKRIESNNKNNQTINMYIYDKCEE